MVFGDWPQSISLSELTYFEQIDPDLEVQVDENQMKVFISYFTEPAMVKHLMIYTSDYAEKLLNS